jgi:pilus assembly protein CpaF
MSTLRIVESSVALEETAPYSASPEQVQLKADIHRELLKVIDLTVLESLPAHELRNELSVLVKKIVRDQRISLSATDLSVLIASIQNEVMGLGPIEPLMADPSVSDILVNGAHAVYVERHGMLEKTPVVFGDDDHVYRIIERIVSRVGRRIDESSPMVDARLPDGSRVNAIIPPLALDGPILSIRRFSASPLGVKELVKLGTITEEIAAVLQALVKAKINFLISGGTGSGKTTLLNMMSAFVPANERIVTIEDAAELRLQQPHVVRLETRPANVEGRGEVSQRALVRNSLRMRPDRIVIGEVRGPEVLDMLQAMNTGHEGSMTTIHANSPRDALSRLENMVGLTGLSIGLKPLRQQIASAISVVIQIARLADGKRKLISLQEITGMEGDVIEMQEIFRFRQAGIAASGAVQGSFQATGIRPRFCDRLAARGAPLPEHLFFEHESLC